MSHENFRESREGKEIVEAFHALCEKLEAITQGRDLEDSPERGEAKELLKGLPAQQIDDYLREGLITREEYDGMLRRYRRISNTVGIWNAKLGKIRHDLNPPESL